MTLDSYNCYPDDADLIIGVLKEARKVIERGWTQNVFASDGHAITNIYNKHAIDFCLIGAIRRVSPTIEIAHRAEIRLAEAVGIDWHEIETWNDKWYRTKKSVLKAFDKAISRMIKISLPRKYIRTPPVLAPSVTWDNRHGVTMFRDATGMVLRRAVPRRRTERARARVVRVISKPLSSAAGEGFPRRRG
jgi:hypothetical protein